jgi:formylglycine-generating enzyme required for sulfatase activity
MWEQVMGSNPSPDYGVGDDYPVYYVSWDDCQEFIDRLNDIDPSHTYRLPTEAEWEYACRAGTTTRFYWGDSDSESTMGRYCWYTENSNSSTHPVASKEPNAWGLHDMSGNVWEWCQDRYTSDYDDCPTNGSAYTSSGSNRVNRGGSWFSNASDCRSANRYSFSPGSGYFLLGFRVARSV